MQNCINSCIDFNHYSIIRTMSAYREDDEVREDFLLVEETLGRVVSHVLLKEWLIPGEKAYWHPGSRSDEIHMNTVRAKIVKNEETENMKDRKGRLLYPWRKVEYNEILVQGNDSRHILMQRSVYSESDTSDYEKTTTEKLKKPVNEALSSTTRVTSEVLKKNIGLLPKLPVNKPKVMQKQTTSPRPTAPVVLPTVSDTESSLESFTGFSSVNYPDGQDSQNQNAPTAVRVTEISTIVDEYEKIRSQNVELLRIMQTTDAVINAQNGNDFLVETDAEKLFEETSSNTSNSEIPQVGEQFLSNPEIPEAGEEFSLEETSDEATNEHGKSWQEKLFKELSIIKKRTALIPVISRTVSELATKVVVLGNRIDAATSTTSNEGDENSTSRVDALLKIKVEADLNFFQEKLIQDAEFRLQFMSKMKRIYNFYNGYTNIVKTQKLCRTIFDESITKFGNWAGYTKKVIEGRTERLLCRSFKEDEIFKMIVEFTGEEFEVQEWIRNTNNNRKRKVAATSSNSPLSNKRQRTPLKKTPSNKTPLKKTPSNKKGRRSKRKQVVSVENQTSSTSSEVVNLGNFLEPYVTQDISAVTKNLSYT